MGKKTSAVLVSSVETYQLTGFEPAVKVELDGDSQCVSATIYDEDDKVLFQSEEGAIFSNFDEDEESTVPEWTFPIFRELCFIS
jgi:hypothetical protein